MGSARPLVGRLWPFSGTRLKSKSWLGGSSTNQQISFIPCMGWQTAKGADRLESIFSVNKDIEMLLTPKARRDGCNMSRENEPPQGGWQYTLGM